ncbi:glycosyltransferase [Seleniivibrio sp.]|uniref:glycosyltransferase family 2 protein n=1 Tax=Seleniivibrio sp. TaxID=2898801 RepID=UPI0025DB3BB4|nr:glycosyltransferase [Seleniivibrio sp.]MCD8554000.1 glycosyltransferase [Seleniivibrio sp.]
MKYSIVIPSYNHEKYIKRCIDSVLNQSLGDFELIIIDDGSKDDSDRIISAYTDKRIKYIRQENAGAHNAINRGLKIAQGDFFAILNSDDEFDPHRLKKCLEVMEKNPDAGLVSTWINVIDADSKKKGVKKAWENMLPWEFNKGLTFADKNKYALHAIMSNFVSTTSNMIFRKEVYETIGGMRNLRFAHDWDFLLRVCSKYRCINVEEALVNYRIHGTNTISTNKKWMLFEICWVIAANIDRFADMIMTSYDSDSIAESAVKLINSFNFQGNEKTFFALYWQINALRQRGVIAPEEIYLDDVKMREKILSCIKE